MTIKIGSYDKSTWLEVAAKSVKYERSFQVEQIPVMGSNPIVTPLGLKEEKFDIEFSLSTSEVDTLKSIMGERVYLKESTYDIIELDDDTNGDLFTLFDARIQQDPGKVSKTTVRLTVIRDRRGV